MAGNILNGGAGNDTIVGSKGADILRGGEGVDTLLGNGGDDIIYFDDEDAFNGGAGADTYNYAGSGGTSTKFITGGRDDDTFNFGDYAGSIGYDFIQSGNGADLILGEVAFSGSRVFSLYVDDYDRAEWSVVIDVEEMPVFVDGDPDVSRWYGFVSIKMIRGDDSVFLERVEANFTIVTDTFEASDVRELSAFGLWLGDGVEVFEYWSDDSYPFASVTILD